MSVLSHKKRQSLRLRPFPVQLILGSLTARRVVGPTLSLRMTYGAPSRGPIKGVRRMKSKQVNLVINPFDVILVEHS